MKNVKMFNRSLAYSLKLYYRSGKLLILLYLFLNLISATLPLALAFIFKYLLDALTEQTFDVPQIIMYVGLYVADLVLIHIVKSFNKTVNDSLLKKADHQYECELLNRMKDLSVSFIDTSKGKDMIDDMRSIKNTAIYLPLRVIDIVSLLYSFFVAFTALIKFNIPFSLLFLILTVPGIVIDIIFDEKSDDLRRKTAPDVRRFCYYRWMLTDAWPAKDVRMYDLTEPIKARYDSEKDEYRAANKRLDKKRLAMSVVMELITRSGELSFTVFVIINALKGAVSIGDVVLYTGFAVSATAAFSQMMGGIAIAYTRTTKRMGRLFDFLSIKDTEDKYGTRTIESFQSLRFENVYFKYPLTEKYILKGASFTLNRGDKMSIVGINGSGKSTIIKLMLGLYEIESGQIYINDRPYFEYDRREIRKLFSVLFQSFVQYPLTLRDNITLSDYKSNRSDGEIIDALSKSDIYEEILPYLDNGLDSYMTRQFDDKGTELSKGQWQKIALSRVYYKDAPIIVFDEPSASLDAEAEDRIFKNFEKVSDNKTGIMISHRISASRMSNKIIVLDDGRIAEEGTHGELMLRGGLYAKLFNLQKEKYTAEELKTGA